MINENDTIHILLEKPRTDFLGIQHFKVGFKSNKRNNESYFSRRFRFSSVDLDTRTFPQNFSRSRRHQRFQMGWYGDCSDDLNVDLSRLVEGLGDL